MCRQHCKKRQPFKHTSSVLFSIKSITPITGFILSPLKFMEMTYWKIWGNAIKAMQEQYKALFYAVGMPEGEKYPQLDMAITFFRELKL